MRAELDMELSSSVIEEYAPEAAVIGTSGGDAQHEM